MEINTAKPGNFCWFELATNDQEAAKKFYGGLFGWRAEDFPMGPNAYYTMFQLRGRYVGAAHTLDQNQAQQGVPPHWGTYVAVANADEAVVKAKTLGGTVLAGPFDVAEHGRMAVLRDPPGAVISVWQAKQHQGVGLWGEEGAFCWSELLTRDTAAATKFYTALFGWKTKVSDMAGLASGSAFMVRIRGMMSRGMSSSMMTIELRLRGTAVSCRQATGPAPPSQGRDGRLNRLFPLRPITAAAAPPRRTRWTWA